MRKLIIRCKQCGSFFTPGHDKDGIPNGVGMELSDGTLVNICSKCICQIGTMTEEEVDKYFEKLFGGSNED